MDVLFLHGPAAAGKHTIGMLLEPLVDMPLFHNHLVVDAVSALFEFGTEPFIELRENMWLEAFKVAAQAGRSFIFTFNPESSVAPDLIERLQSLVEEAGGRVLFIELHCSDRGIEERIGSPGRAQYGKLLDPNMYRIIKAEGGFDFPPLPEPLVSVDTESQAPIESARMIAEAFAAYKESEISHA